MLDNDAEGYVYCSPRCGGFQIALAYACNKKNVPLFIFTPNSKELHQCSEEAACCGAIIKQVRGGYMNVLNHHAKKFIKGAHQNYKMVTFGGNSEIAIGALAKTMRECSKALGKEPDEVWCAIGSGTLVKGVLCGTDTAKIFGVQVGKDFIEEHPRLTVLKYHRPFSHTCKSKFPFPSNPWYDRKALEYCLEYSCEEKLVLFWNVM